jgi:proline iminopeptidase
VHPIPPADAEGFTETTPLPLYWRADGPRGASPLLLLHGGPGAHHDYLYPQMLALAARHRLVTYDQRGGGRSKTDDPTPITWRTQVDDLARVAVELGARPRTLVGYSWGALLALLYTIEAARAAPSAELTVPTRLVLISPAPASRAWRAEFDAAFSARQQGEAIQRLRAELAASGLRDRDPAAWRQRSFELSVAGYFADPGKAADLTPFRVTGRVQQSIWESLGDFDLREALVGLRRAVHLPAIVVHGRQDPIPLASAAAIADALEAEFVALADCGHVPYVEQPTALFSAIDEFLVRAT